MAKNYNFDTFSFSDFPEDIQLRILSFLSPSDLSSFAFTSKRFVSLCHGDNGVWYAMCDARWGSKTNLRRWFDPQMGFNFKLLFNTLSQYDNLIGFWRRSGSESGIIGDAPLVFFEWGVSNVIGSRVAPCKDGSYNVIKSPFIWISLTPEGKTVNYLKPPECDPIRVSVSLVEKGHVVFEESRGEYGNNNNNNNGYRMNENFGNVVDEDNDVDIIGSPRDRLTSEMYQYFANRKSPRAAGERGWRRQRRREKERQGRRKWEAQHLVKVVHCSPTPLRPLQGLWKGICNDMTLDFYLVEYDDIGGIECRRVGESTKPCSGYAPIFWTSNATFIDSPLSHEENYLYKARLHLRPTCEVEDIHKPFPLHVMYINSSYDLIAPNIAGISTNSQHVEGRIWQYIDGTFGFGFLCDNNIVDMKHMAKNGRLLNIDELCSG